MKKTITIGITCFFLLLTISLASAQIDPCNADVNDDGTVNILDMISVRNLLNKDTNNGDNWKADINSDGKIDILDMIIVRNNLNEECDSSDPPHQLDSCDNISESGVYHLTKDLTGEEVTITNNGTGCFVISEKDVVLDCQGHTISADFATAGVYSNSTNTIIRNCKITMKKARGGYGIRLTNSHGSSVINNVLNNQYYGLYLDNSNHVEVINNTAISNYYFDVYSPSDRSISHRNAVIRLIIPIRHK